MTTKHASLLAIVAAGSFLFWPAASSAIDKPPTIEVDGNIEWVYDYDKAKLRSQISGKPMFVVFRCER